MTMTQEHDVDHGTKAEASHASTPECEGNVVLHLRLHIALIALGPIALLLNALAAQFPWATEHAYARLIGPLMASGQSLITRWLPFSLAEAILWGLVLWLVRGALWGVGQGVWRKRRKRSLGNIAARGVLQLLATASVLITIFYTAWGFSYSRPTFIERQGWEDVKLDEGAETGTAALAALCEELVTNTNEAYERLHGCRDTGEPTALKRGPVLKEIDKAADEGFERVAESLGLGRLFAVSRGPAKPVFASGIMSHLLILGFYSPWTGEANFNQLTPGCHLAHTIAHEKAHQRSITSEDEANFFGFLACIMSDHPHLQYSGYLFAQQQLLRELMRRDREAGKALLEKRYKGVRRDEDSMRDFGKRYSGKVSNVSHKMNDVYLKANRVKGGVKSYGMSARLILLYAQQNGGTLSPSERPGGSS